MCRPTGDGESEHQRALLSPGKLILRRLANNNVFGIPLQRIRGLGTDTVRFLADEEKITKVGNAVSPKTIARLDHCRNDSLGVACPTPVKERIILTNR